MREGGGAGLTDEGEGGREDEEHAVAVHGEGDGEIHRQASPHEELVHSRPVVDIQTDLQHTHTAILVTGVVCLCVQGHTVCVFCLHKAWTQVPWSRPSPHPGAMIPSPPPLTQVP